MVCQSGKHARSTSSFMVSLMLFVKTTAFLQKMACEMDLDKMPNSDGTFEGEIVGRKREPLKPVFEPMRRKLHLPASS
jgi:hypothetical protein